MRSAARSLVALGLLLYAAAAVFAPASAAATGVADAAADAPPLRITINDLTFELAVLGVPVMPGETLHIHVAGGAGAALTLDLDGRDVPLQAGTAQINAPATPGHYVMRLRAGSRTHVVNLLVMVPREMKREARINGFRVGRYPPEPLRGMAIYDPPDGFIEVTAANRSVLVSPSYTLGEFVAKQPGGFPKYLVLRPRLLLKLELIADELRKAGRPVGKFTIMSGYRTPFYNAAIGNGAYSRHVWGGAADIFIDENPKNGRMDDLNGDGRVDIKDAQWLWNFIDELSKSGKLGDLKGGLGLYGPNPVRGPFIHVDVRGFEARW